MLISPWSRYTQNHVRWQIPCAVYDTTILLKGQIVPNNSNSVSFRRVIKKHKKLVGAVSWFGILFFGPKLKKYLFTLLLADSRT